MAIYYKFKSAKAFDSIPIEGQFISVANLKERIFESKHLGRGTDFDVMVSNAQSNEEYVDEAAMIPKNTSVLIRRVPGQPRKPIVTEPEELKIVKDMAEEVPLPPSSMLIGDSSTAAKYPEESDWDGFGNDLYAIPEVPALPANPVIDITPSSKIDEENKLRAFIETPALDWSSQGQNGYGGGRGYGRGTGGRMIPGRGFGRGGYERKTPPAGYICYRCKTPGHFIQHCPTNGDSSYDVKKVKQPTGIPKSMLMATPDGPYALPSGAVAVLKPNEATFEKEMAGIPSSRPVTDLPPELRCPLCKEVMRDVVLTSKCCFRSFCDKCIRDYLIGKSMCVCGARNILADDLLPNTTLREAISRILESTTSSIENLGSMIQVQDMESSRPMTSKDRSPTPSVASRDEHKRTPTDHFSNVMVVDGKQADAVSEGKAVKDTVYSMENETIINTGHSEATNKAKEPILPESTPVTEGREKLLVGEQGKKKKKKARPPGSDVDMKWRGPHDLGAAAYGGMPLAPSAYNLYWGGGMPTGMDGYMTPFGGAMPYMGYAPGPFDVPFGGMLPADPFAAQGYLMPPFPPRDLAELSFNSMNMNRGPAMSREEFEARKADIRRKRELERERINGREHTRDSRGTGKDVRSGGADVSSMKAKPQLIAQAEGPNQSNRALSNSHSHMDRHPRKSPRHSPPPYPRPPAKRMRSPEHDYSSRKEDEKQKGSVFSRISFSESEKEAKRKKRESSPSSSAAAPASVLANGVVKDQHHHHRRDEAVATRHGLNGYRRRGSSYEDESSREEGEDDDEEYHFKRRPSSSSSRREIVREREEESRERDRGHERAESRRR